MKKIGWLDPGRLAFPPLDEALDDPNGLLAAGGDLSPDRLLLAYRSGIFPWYEDNQPILWWSPEPRTVLFPGELTISRSLRKCLRSDRFEARIDTAFDEVVQACSEPRDGTPGTWITGDMKRAYGRLHRLGYAHSFETWRAGELVGGLYGVGIGRLFFGESMFHRATDASKVALAWLCRLMVQNDCPLIDCQLENPHLTRLGARPMPRADFRQWLDRYCEPVQPGPWGTLPSSPGSW